MSDANEDSGDNETEGDNNEGSNRGELLAEACAWEVDGFVPSRSASHVSLDETFTLFMPLGLIFKTCDRPQFLRLLGESKETLKSYSKAWHVASASMLTMTCTNY